MGVDLLSKRARGRRRREPSRVMRALTHMRAGWPYSERFSDLRNIQRWLASWVYVCSDRNATGVSSQRLELYHRTGQTPRATKSLLPVKQKYLKSAAPHHYTDDSVQVEDHPFLDLLAEPNEMLAGYQLIWLTVMHLQLTGHAYWHKSGMEDGAPVELWPLPPQFVYPIVGEASIYETYELRMAGVVQKFAAEEIVHFRKPSPIDTISGFGNLRGMLESAETDIRMQEYERAVFENMAVPDVLISPKDMNDMSTEGIERLEQSWRERYQGWRKRGQAAVSPFPLDVVTLGNKNRELEFEKGKMWIRDKIAAGFGVPSPILQPTNATFTNMDFSLQSWSRWTLRPICRAISDTINRNLLRAYTPREEDGLDETPSRPPWFCAFDDPVPDDVEGQTARDAQDTQAGIRTINEIRADRGEEPVPWGEEPWMPAGVVQPTVMAEQAAFEADLQTAQAEAQRRRDDAALELQTRDQEARLQQTTDAAALEAGKPIATFSELAAAMQAALDRNDLDMANLLRSQMASLLGGTVPDLEEIKPSGSTGVANPEDAAEPEPMPGMEDQENGDGGPPQPGEEEKPETEDEEEKPPKKPEGKALRELSGLAFDSERWVSAVNDAYAKIEQSLMRQGSKEQMLQSVIIDMFAEFEAAVQASLHELGAQKATDAELALLAKLYNRDEWVGRFAIAAEPSLLKSYEDGMRLAAIEAGGMGHEIPYLNPGIIIDNVKASLEGFASSVVDTTGEQIIGVLEPMLQEGRSVREMAQAIGELYGDKRDKHAKLIARTEINSALNAGAADTWKSAGIDKHTWLASASACEFCQTLDGKTVDLGQAFLKRGDSITGVRGGTYRNKYRDVKHPTLHPNCTCATRPVV